MATGDFPPPEGMIWTDTAGWVSKGAEPMTPAATSTAPGAGLRENVRLGRAQYLLAIEACAFAPALSRDQDLSLRHRERAAAGALIVALDAALAASREAETKAMAERDEACKDARQRAQAVDRCQQAAGKALGYPWFKDDQRNFPGATEENGVCIGEHVEETIIEELAAALAAANARAKRLAEALKPFAKAAREFDFAVAPDGIDDGLTVVAQVACRPEREATLCTSHFSAAAAALAEPAAETQETGTREGEDGR